MKSLLYYLIQVIICSGILYGYYHFFLRNKKFHVYNRFYLLIAATLSILIPFLSIPVYFYSSETNASFVLKTITSFPASDFTEPDSSTAAPLKNNSLGIRTLLLCGYVLISTIVMARILFSLKRISQMKRKYIIEKLNSIYFVNTTEPGTPFSFFNWLFWNQKIELKSGKGEQVFRHELFHIEQKHSLDILYLEFLAIIFWMNPFLHFIRKETKVIHEFLADQFAINKGGKWEYAELLLMRSLNTEQHLTNPFFYNQIKRRIAMITSSQKTSYKYLRKIMVLPVAIVVIALFAFSYKNKKAKNFFIPLDKPVTVVIDAGHGMDPSGSHTGVTASDGSHEDDIVLSIAKKIKELNTNDRVQIILTREDKNIVDLKKRVEFSNSQNADLLISLHTNAASNEEKDTKGIDVMYSGKNAKYYAENKILATILYNYFYQVHSVNEIKLSKNNVYIIDKSDCPSALVECGYLTDPNDLSFVKGEKGQAQIAKSILQSIEQYFSQKSTSDWEERKKVVSDTALPVVKFTRNSVTRQMEGSYDGKKFNKMTEYEGQFAFFFDDDSSTMIMIGKEQTEALKKQYGKNLNELLIKDPGTYNSGKSEPEKELLSKQQAEQTEPSTAEKEFLLKQQKHQEYLEESQKEYLTNQQKDQEYLEKSKKEYLAKQQKDQEYLEKTKKEYLARQQKDQDYLEKTKKDYLTKQQKDQEYLEKSKKEYLAKRQRDQEYLEKSTNEYLRKQQNEQAELEKATKEFLIKQRDEQEQIENSTKEYLLKQQKEDSILENSGKEFLLRQQEAEKQSEKQPLKAPKTKPKSKS